MARTLGDAFVTIRPDMRTFPGEVSTGVAKSERSFASRLGSFAKIAAGAGAVAGAAFTVKFTAEAAVLDSQMREVVTLLGVTGKAADKELGRVRSQVRGLSDDFGIAQQTLTSGLYQAISAGVPKQNVLSFMQVASKASIGGVTDVETAVDGLSTTINAFGLKASQAQEVADSMFTAVKGGKTTFRELSDSLFNVAPAAAAAGVGFKEVNAAVATLTASGTPTSVATTQIRSALVGLQRPSAELDAIFQALGYSSAQQAVKQKGLVFALGEVKKATHGNNGELQKLLGSQEAVAAANVLAGTGAKKFRQEMDAQAKSAGATNKAFQVVQQGAARQWAVFRTGLKNIGLSVGQALLPGVTKVLTLINTKALPVVSEFAESFSKKVGGAIGSLVQNGLPRLGSGIKGAFGTIKNALAGVDWQKIGDGIKTAGAAIKEASPDAVNKSFSAFGAVIGFATDHVDLLVKALPFLVAGFVAIKTAQAANNLVGRNSAIGFYAQTTATGALAVSNFALARSQKAATAASLQQQGVEKVGLVTRLRTTVATVASTVAQKAAALASKAWAGAQWLLNAALNANPISVVIIALVALGAALFVAWKKSDTFRKIVEAAWDKIKAAISAAWEKGIKPALQAMQRFVSEKLAPGLRALWSKVVQPVFRKVGQIIRWTWEKVIHPALKLWWGYYTKVLFPILRALWEKVIQPVFSKLGAFIRTTWEKVIQPAFSGLKNGVAAVRDAFKRAVDRIREIWAGIKDAARAPVAFVVNTVYNNGLRKVINLIPGVPDLPEVAFSGGGPVEGGIRGKDSVRALMMPGEHVFTAGEVAKFGGQRAILRLRELIRKGAFDKGALRRGGDLGWPVPRFADGGSLTAEQIAAGQNFARSQAGKPYVWGGVGPNGYDCSGFMSAVTNVVRGQYPYRRVGTSASFPWAGFLPGWGQFTVGAFTGSPGHVAGTLGGLNMESTDGYVRVGSAARGAGDPIFSRIAHLGAGGKAAAKAGGFWEAVKALKNLPGEIHKWMSSLSAMGGWGGMVRQVVGGVASEFRSWVNDKIPGPGPLPHFDRGGLARGRGIMVKATDRTERVLSPEQNDDLEELLRLLLELLRRGGLGPLVKIDNLNAKDEQAAAYALRAELQKLLTLWGAP